MPWLFQQQSADLSNAAAVKAPQRMKDDPAAAAVSPTVSLASSLAALQGHPRFCKRLPPNSVAEVAANDGKRQKLEVGTSSSGPHCQDSASVQAFVADRCGAASRAQPLSMRLAGAFGERPQPQGVRTPMRQTPNEIQRPGPLSSRMADVLVERSQPLDEPASAGAIALLDDENSGVFLDSAIAVHLQPHQRDGLRFMARHVYADTGCILADSMGLGKTLQAICLVWVALNRPASKPCCQKAAIVCPSALCTHWDAECAKWLGPLRIRPVVILSGSSTAATADMLRNFTSSGRLLIISYEMLRQHAHLVDGVIDLLVCDEGHRLKSATASTAKRLIAMRCRRRVLLTGTPLQNNLEEFWHCLTFVQPTFLPPLSMFQRMVKPISRAQDVSASVEEVELGSTRSHQLAQLAKTVILRRGPELLETILPPRIELLLTVPLTRSQVAAYRSLCTIRFATPNVGHDGSWLSLLMMLRQLCNADPQQLLLRCRAASSGSKGSLRLEEPQQLDDEIEDTDDPAACRADLANVAPRAGILQLCAEVLSRTNSTMLGNGGHEADCGKTALLRALLRFFQRSAPDDGIVIASGFLEPLKRCEGMCEELGIPVGKISGTTPAQTRVDIVNSFNARRGCRVLLLSVKSGGVGLNVVGANRLIMLEPDWNPAIDLQAMGRVWRQGQTKPVFIYRFASLGTIEEKMLQRQARKQGLAAATFDSESRLRVADCLASDISELRRVFVLEGYDKHGGVSSPGTLDDKLKDLPQAVTILDAAAAAACHGVRVLSSSHRAQ